MTQIDHAPQIVRKRKQYELTKRLLIVMLAICFAAATIGFTWAFYSAYRTQERIESCTTPGRACYESQTGVLLEDLELLIVEQQQLQEEGTIPLQENLERTRVNQDNIARILAILERMEARQAGRPLPEAEDTTFGPTAAPPPSSSPQAAPASPPTTPSAPAPAPAPTDRPTSPGPIEEDPDPIIGCLPLINVCI